MAKASRALLQAQARVKELDELLQARNTDVVDLSRQVEFVLKKHQMAEAENDQLRQANGELEQAAGVSAATIKQLTEQRDRHYGERETFRLEAREANKARDAAEADNVRLRDHLHSLTVANARLEGQLERVHEFDPVTEQVRYRDRLRPIQVSDGDGYLVNAMSSPDRDRWYRRG